MAGRRRSGLSLAAWLFASIGLLVLLVAGSAAAVTRVLGQRAARQAVHRDLEGGHSALTELQRQRYLRLQLIGRIFSTDEILTAYLAEAAQERDPDAILDFVNEYQNLLNFNLAVVLDRNGRVLGRTDDRDAVGEDLSESSLVALALEENEALGVWREGEGFYHAAAVPLKRQFDLAGYIVVAFAINDALALQIQRASGAEIVFLANSPAGPEVDAATLGPALREELIPALRLGGEVLSRVTQRGETADQVELALDGRPWFAVLTPLKDAAGEPVGAAVALAALDRRLEDTRKILVVLAGIGAIALVLGLGLSLLVARRTQRPAALLAAAAERAVGGDLEAALPAVGGGPLGRLRDALDGMIRGLREKLALERFLGGVARQLPEPARGGALARPQARQLALVGVEMRRFASPRIGYDPEENLGRLGRDLRRVSAAAEARQGRVEALSGHRVLVAFEGEGHHIFQALAVATEILLILSERESVFDEPEPPVVAVTAGPAITGTVAWGDRAGPAVAGLPVQQLESLMREAAPGEIYLSKQVHAALAEAFQHAGVEIREQRGLVSPQPLFSLSAELAGRVTGVETAPETTAGFADERRGLADLKPGTVLGSRFDILAELGVGPTGVVFKARDRELDDLVTLKMLRPEVVADPGRFEHLRGVIRTLRTIRHPNLLGVIDFGEAEGLPFISTEFERGMTLRQVLDLGRRVPLVPGLRLARQICRGLLAVHGEGLAHRGVKPENVLVEASGNVRLMDCGLATPGGALAGAEYLAPEQLDGREADARTDVYALGAVLYEAFTGQPPYAGASPDEVRRQQLAADPAPPSGLCEMPPALERAILRCLAKAPDQRYRTLAEVLEALEAVV